MTTDKLGLYVHIPYCVRKCNYCDFCSLPNGREAVPDEYVRTLIKEISSYRKDEKYVLDTVYFGGGTPSLLSVEQMEKIWLAIRDSFSLSSGAEVTFEANPGTLDFKKAEAFYNLGFNRVSLGLQSIHENEMKKLGRIHTYDDFLSVYHILREVGFNNINVDLMYGIPYQTKDSFYRTLSDVITLSPEHVSAYGLILEEGTPLFSEADSLPMPSLDDECDMYDMCRDLLSAHGYEHYEISNYARKGRRSRHNSLYWKFGEYIGVGAAAHSYLDGRRFSNTDSVCEYISSFSDTKISETDVDPAYEYAMLALRTKDGFALSDYESRFGSSFIDGKTEILGRLVNEGLLIVSDGRIALTERGFYLSNSILVEIL